MDDLEDLEVIEEMEEVEAVFGVERVFRDRTNPFDFYSDSTFLDSFRLTKGGVHYLLQLLQDKLAPMKTSPGITLTSEDQVLITLSYFGSSSFMRVIGDFFGAHKSSISRAVKRCTFAIVTLRRQFIEFPDVDEMEQIKQHFLQIAGIPGKYSTVQDIIYHIINTSCMHESA